MRSYKTYYVHDAINACNIYYTRYNMLLLCLCLTITIIKILILLSITLNENKSSFS